MELVFSSHKSRPHGGPNSILFLSLHSFSKSQSKRRSQRREAAQPWSVGAQAVGLSLLLCFHSFKPVTAGVFRALLLTQQSPRGISSLCRLVHLLRLFIPSCSVGQPDSGD